MGNWRCVNIVGSIDPADVPALRARLIYNTYGDDWNGFGPLSFDPNCAGLASLGD